MDVRSCVHVKEAQHAQNVPRLPYVASGVVDLLEGDGNDEHGNDHLDACLHGEMQRAVDVSPMKCACACSHAHIATDPWSLDAVLDA